MNGAGLTPTTITMAEPLAGRSELSPERLRALIDLATVDCNDETDEHAGLMGMIWEEVICPFPARIDEIEVECLGFQCPRRGYGMNAICRSRKGKTLVVDVGKLTLVAPKPRGFEWIEAYFAWRTMQDD